MASAIVTRYRQEWLAVFVAAVVLRGLVYVVMGLKAHNLAGFAALSDGSAYIDNAKRINGDGMPNAYDQRVFVGLPWLIAITHRLGVPYYAAAAGIGLVLPGAMCVLTARWLHDRRIGWAMAVLPPHWVLDTAAVMNESMMIGLCAVAMLAVRRRAWWGVAPAGLAFAAAGMARPMACFAVAGAVALLLQAGRPAKAAALAAVTLIVLTLMFALFRAMYWNPLDNVRAYDAQPLAYNGQVFTYPLGSFVDAFRTRGLLNKSVIYKSASFAAAVGVLCLAAAAWWRRRRPLDAWAVTWWGTNLVFASCIGSHWGVDIAQRSLMWAAPAAYWTLRDWLPTRWWSRTLWAAAAVPWVFVTSQT